MGDEGEFAGAAAGAGSFSAHSSRDKAFEIFVKRTITSIQKEAWGRSKEVKEIREACQAFLNSLDQTGGCPGRGRQPLQQQQQGVAVPHASAALRNAQPTARHLP